MSQIRRAAAYKEEVLQTIQELRGTILYTEIARKEASAELWACIMAALTEAVQFPELEIVATPREIHLREKIEDCEANIRRLKQRLLAITPPKDFTEEFGWTLYMLYKEKHPSIDGNTQLRKTDYRPSCSTHVLTERSILEIPLSPLAPSCQIETRPFEKWANDVGQPFIAFAYLPASNVLAWARLERNW